MVCSWGAHFRKCSIWKNESYLFFFFFWGGGGGGGRDGLWPVFHVGDDKPRLEALQGELPPLAPHAFCFSVEWPCLSSLNFQYVTVTNGLHNLSYNLIS